VAFFLGDVSGKGIGAAVLMAATQSQLRSLLLSGIRLSVAVDSVNRYLHQRTDSGKFVTLIAGVLDAASATIELVDAGHGMCCIVSGEGVAERFETDGDLPLGVSDGHTYRAVTRELGPGGRLVVFTDGTDRASRVSEDEMLQAVRDSPYDVFAIGLGAELSEADLEQIGKSGTALAKDSSEIQTAFETIGKRIEQLTKSYYLLSYCSPARAGEHTVTVKGKHLPEGKKKEITGELETGFDAEGFEKGCDPNTKPKFDITKGDMVADEPPGKSKGKASASASASSK